MAKYPGRRFRAKGRFKSIRRALHGRIGRGYFRRVNRRFGR